MLKSMKALNSRHSLSFKAVFSNKFIASIKLMAYILDAKSDAAIDEQPVAESKEEEKTASYRELAKKVVAKTAEAADEVMHIFGHRAVDAVIKSVRGSLDELWRVFGGRDCISALKDVEFGTRVQASASSLVLSY